MDLRDATRRATEIRALYAKLEESTHGRSWTTEEILLGLVGDVGDLAKLVQAAEGVRAASDLKNQLPHELADCLWAILVLADRLGVDIESAFTANMSDLEAIIHKGLENQDRVASATRREA
ncbi:MAG: nucleotide pyrophosphohydrolase [Chitinivibrionales bacterium]|nr:nucleotide pyrophosphohydrolase [Chitinivibrionales bacterium]